MDRGQAAVSSQNDLGTSWERVQPTNVAHIALAQTQREGRVNNTMESE